MINLFGNSVNGGLKSAPGVRFEPQPAFASQAGWPDLFRLARMLLCVLPDKALGLAIWESFNTINCVGVSPQAPNS